jgi:hypothetical protein
MPHTIWRHEDQQPIISRCAGGLPTRCSHALQVMWLPHAARGGFTEVFPVTMLTTSPPTVGRYPQLPDMAQDKHAHDVIVSTIAAPV